MGLCQAGEEASRVSTCVSVTLPAPQVLVSFLPRGDLGPASRVLGLGCVWKAGV